MRTLSERQLARALRVLEGAEGEYVSMGGTGREGAGFSQRGGVLYRVDVADDLSGPHETAITGAELRAQLQRVDLDSSASTHVVGALRQLGLALPTDPVDRALCEAADALLESLNLWCGAAALLVRNFQTHEVAVVHDQAGTGRPVAGPWTREREALLRVERAEPRALAEAMSAASPSSEPVEPLQLEPISLQAGSAKLEAHLARSQLSSARVRGLEVLAPLAGHQLWDLGDRRYHQLTTTALFALAPERAVLFEYVGDGP